MTGSGGRDPEGERGADGGPARHVPVLREEVLAALQVGAGLYLDATFGAGGYSSAILAIPGTRVLALDRDPSAIHAGGQLVEKFGDRLTLAEARFADMCEVATRKSLTAFDGVVFDIGVSSMQIDEAARGFSFRQDGPLDMRMSGTGPSASDILAEASEETIADILYHFGEERFSRKIARAIVADREARPFTSTLPLAALVARLVPHKPTDIHPATRTFQALRIAVNDELRELVDGLASAERLLGPGGRLAVVTFHSLEDRIVKQFFAKRSGKGEAQGRRLPGEPEATPPSFALGRGQPVTPSDAECAKNPRARSAKLRFATRTEHAALPPDDGLLGLASLPHTPAVRPGKAKRP